MKAEEWLYPYGDRAASVYWVRRGGAALAILILLIVIWPSGGGSKKPPTASGTHTSTTSPSPTPTVVVPACADADVLVSADSNSQDYPAGSNPQITISIKNTSTSTCSIDTSQRFLTISSGTDKWWSSQACLTGAQPKISIAPTQTIKSTYVWTRIRQVTGCTSNGNAPVGTYLAKAHLGTGLETPGATIRLH